MVLRRLKSICLYFQILIKAKYTFILKSICVEVYTSKTQGRAGHCQPSLNDEQESEANKIQMTSLQFDVNCSQIAKYSESN